MWAGRACEGCPHLHSLVRTACPQPSSRLARVTFEAPPGRMAVAANQTNRRRLDGHYTSLPAALASLLISRRDPRGDPRCGREVRPMRLHHTVPAKVERVVRDLPTLTPLSPEARRRLRWLDYCRAHGQNVSLTCRHFGITRPTFYRWKRQHTGVGKVELQRLKAMRIGGPNGWSPIRRSTFRCSKTRWEKSGDAPAAGG